MNKTTTALGIGLLTLAAGAAFARPPHLEKFDIDQDGSVTRAEAESGAASRAQELDADGDGIITLREMQAAHERRRQEHMQRRLDAADANGDGVVGLDEFSAQIVEHLMSRDRNDDGLLSAADRPARGEHRPRHDRR